MKKDEDEHETIKNYVFTSIKHVSNQILEIQHKNSDNLDFSKMCDCHDTNCHLFRSHILLTADSESISQNVGIMYK